MSVLLHHPKPDETWQSVVATYLRGWARPTRWRIAKRLLGSALTPVAYDFPRGIHKVVTGLPNGLGLEPKSVLLSHTLLPLHRPFLSPEQWQRAIVSALKDNHLHFVLGIGPSRIPQIKWLRMCPHCARADRRTWGCAYWHRIHQLPGVLICPKHNVALRDTNVRAHRNSAFELIAADDATIQNSDQLPLGDFKLLKGIASDLEVLLLPECPAPGSERLRSAYYASLAQQDLLTPSGRIMNTKLCSKVVDFFGEPLLKALGCSIDFRRRDHWLQRLVRKSRGHQAPLRHVLLIRYLGFDVCTFLKQACGVAIRPPVPSVKREAPIHPRITPELLETKQRAWLDICHRETGNRRQKHDSLYSWLWRYCREWLLTEGKFADGQLLLRLNTKSKLDERLAAEVFAAARRSLAENPSARLSRRKIAEQTSRPNLVKNNVPDLPATMAAVKNVVETVELHAQRRLLIVAKKLPAKQRHHRWRLILAAGLSAPVAKRPAIQKTLADLTKRIPA